MRPTKDANPQHPHDLFTTSSLLWPIVVGMRTNEATLAPTTPGPSERPNRTGPEPGGPGAVVAGAEHATKVYGALAVARAYWPHPIGPPRLAPEALHKAQADTLATPRLRYDPFSRLMFLTVNVLYGRRRSLEKFLVLEQLARIPYQAWERLAQRAIAHSQGRSTLAGRIMERVVEARAQQDNEQFHLLILEELLAQQRATPLGRLRYRILPRIIAGPWHVFTWLLHLVRPTWSYRLNANFEDHAEHEYMAYVAEHPELDRQRVHGAIAADYGRFASLGDLLRQIGHDERVHKLESLPGDDTAHRNQTRDELDSSARRAA